MGKLSGNDVKRAEQRAAGLKDLRQIGSEIDAQGWYLKTLGESLMAADDLGHVWTTGNTAYVLEEIARVEMRLAKIRQSLALASWYAGGKLPGEGDDNDGQA